MLFPIGRWIAKFAICTLQFSIFNVFSHLMKRQLSQQATHLSARVSLSNLPTTSFVSGGANAYASSRTIGVSKKFSVGGGEGVCHSSPGKCHGFASAMRP